jgi:HlyD family secretion protein
LIARTAAPIADIMATTTRVEPISDAVRAHRQVAFDRPPDGVSSGEMAEVTLTLPPVKDAVVVPNASLRHRGAQQGVWRYADGQLGFVPVTTGAEGLDGTVQILEGLQVGDQVVVYSERDLDDGSRVTVVPTLRGATP